MRSARCDAQLLHHAHHVEYAPVFVSEAGVAESHDVEDLDLDALAGCRIPMNSPSLVPVTRTRATPRRAGLGGWPGSDCGPRRGGDLDGQAASWRTLHACARARPWSGGVAYKARPGCY